MCAPRNPDGRIRCNRTANGAIQHEFNTMTKQNADDETTEGKSGENTSDSMNDRWRPSGPAQGH